MNHIQIRKVPLTDLDQLQNISRQTFTETFAKINDEENMRRYLDESFGNEQLLNELKNSNSTFYFAVIDNQVVGYLKINVGDAQKELKNENALEIERIYVLEEFHRQKVGQRLYEKALEIGKHLKLNYLWLGVWENNFRAIKFYQKNGFVEFDKHLFILGEDKQIDIMMKLEIMLTS